MAKTAGFPAKVEITDAGTVVRDLSNDITDFTVATPRGEQAVTGLDKFAMERIALLGDAKFTIKGPYNPAANRSHDVFTGLVESGLPSLATITLPPATTGAPQLPLNLLWYDFSYTRNPNGEFVWQCVGDLADGALPTWTTSA